MSIFSQSGIRARCQATMGSVTLAMKAKRALASANIPCEVVKIKSGDSDRRGCVYGIEYPCELMGNVQALLSEYGLKPH